MVLCGGSDEGAEVGGVVVGTDVGCVSSGPDMRNVVAIIVYDSYSPNSTLIKGLYKVPRNPNRSERTTS